MTTDFRAMCAELVATLAERIDDKGDAGPYFAHAALLLTRARAALAEAVPEGKEPASVIEQPTIMQLIELSDEIEAAGLGQIDFARAVLARWGNSASQPVPVSERLPRSEDCDAEGKCWWGRSESNDWSADWTLATHEAVAEFYEFSPQAVWLPAHALPLPDTND